MIADRPDQSHAWLLERLNAVPKSPAAWLVVLWTFYQSGARLRDAENRMVAQGISPQRLQPLEESLSSLWVGIQEACTHGDDVTLLRTLIGLDRMLGSLPRRALGADVFEGADGRSYRLIRRRNLIADVLDDTRRLQTESADQSPTIRAYARRIAVVPVEPVNGVRIQHRSEWPDYLSASVELALTRRIFKVLMWPFERVIEFPAIDTLADNPAFVRLNEPRNEGDLIEDIAEAIRKAADLQATILLFPELCATPAMLEKAMKARTAAGSDYPVLTVIGLCHHQRDGVWWNESVVLGPRADVLHRHVKLTRFCGGPELPCSEEIQTGDSLTVLEFEFGALAVLICLDLFQPECTGVTEASGANVLIVPSLSQTTSAHLTAANRFRVTQLSSTLVCNRPLLPAETTREKATSFAVIPAGKNAEFKHFPDNAGAGYLLFTL